MMHCTDTGRVVVALNGFADKRHSRVSENITESGRRSATYNIMITERKNTQNEKKKKSTDPREEYIGFATNAPDIDASRYASSGGWRPDTG